MAIDTLAKRHSAIHVSNPWRSRIPVPDGTISQGDRQATAYMYSGILAEAGAVITPDNRDATGINAINRSASGIALKSQSSTGTPMRSQSVTGRAPN